MAKIPVSVAIDSAAFVKFYDIFQQYRTAFDEHPKAWGEAARQAGKSAESFADAAKSIRQLADNMSGVLKNSQEFERSSGTAANHWTRMARGTHDVAANIKGATESLLHWAKVAGIVTGIAATGSIFGVDSLAAGVASNRSSALGLNTSYGGLTSFRANFRRFGDPDSFLGGLANAQNDVAGRVPFYSLGMRPEQWQGRDTSELGADVLESFKTWVDKVPDDVLNNQLQNSQLGNFFSPDMARRIKQDSVEEIHKQANAIRTDRSGMAVDPQAQRRWQEFTTQVDRAKTQIEAVFMTQLAQLEPSLEKLSATIADFAAKLLGKDGPVASWLSEFNGELQWLAQKIDSPSFKQDVAYWFEQVERVGSELFQVSRSIIAFVHRLAVLLGSDTGKSAPGTGNPTTSLAGGSSVTTEQLARYHGGMATHGGHQFRQSLGQPKWWTEDRQQHVYDRLVAGGMSPIAAEAAVARWAYVEAPNGPTSSNNIAGGHWGLMQMDANRFGKVKGDKYDADSQIDAALNEWKNGDEARSAHKLQTAKDAHDAAVGMSMYERAGGYSKWSGEDDYTAKTEAAIPRVHAVVSRPRTHVTISKNPGGNPISQAAAHAGPP